MSCRLLSKVKLWKSHQKWRDFLIFTIKYDDFDVLLVYQKIHYYWGDIMLEEIVNIITIPSLLLTILFLVIDKINSHRNRVVMITNYKESVDNEIDAYISLALRQLPDDGTISEFNEYDRAKVIEILTRIEVGIERIKEDANKLSLPTSGLYYAIDILVYWTRGIEYSYEEYDNNLANDLEQVKRNIKMHVDLVQNSLFKN